MITYNSSVIQDFAKQQYTLANLMLLLYTIIGAAFGAFIGTAVLYVLSIDNPGLYATLGGGLVGFLLGLNRASEMKLAAQFALCLAQIETNTSNANSRTFGSSQHSSMLSSRPTYATTGMTTQEIESTFGKPEAIEIDDKERTVYKYRNQVIRFRDGKSCTVENIRVD